MSGTPRASSSRRLGAGAVVVLVIAAFAVTVGIGLFRGCAVSAEEVPELAASPGTTSGAIGSAAPVYVHVAGAVVQPGLYALPSEARVVDAIAAAGGLDEGADAAAVNLARPVSDGEQLIVPEIGAAPEPQAGGGGSAGAAADDVVNLNTADQTALETLPRIGPALAERIVAWRDENGSFTSIEDLLAVPGIGDKMLEGLRPHVRV